MIIVDLIYVLPHAGYQNVFPGLGEPISGNKSTNRWKKKQILFFAKNGSCEDSLQKFRQKKNKKGKKGYFFILEHEFRTNKKSYQKSHALRFLGYP